MTVIPHDREQRTTILTMAKVILTEEAEHVDGVSPVTSVYGDMTSPISFGLHFLGQQLPRGPNGEFEYMICGDTHSVYRKCNVPASLEELAGQHASTWSRVTPVVGNKSGAPPITQTPPGSSVGPITTPYPHGGSGERPRSRFLSVADVTVLGVNDAGRGAGV